MARRDEGASGITQRTRVLKDVFIATDGSMVDQSGSALGLTAAQIAATQALVSGAWNTAVAIGNSITADILTETTGPTSRSTMARGYLTWANARLKQRFKVLAVKGVTGETTTQIAARVATDVYPYSPRYAIACCLATNDINAGDSAATVKANLTALWDALQARGAFLVTSTDIPRNGFTSAKNAVLLEVNRWIIEQQYVRPNMVAIDMFSAVVDPTSATVQARANYLRDGTHPAPLGAYAMGDPLYTWASSAVPDYRAPVASVSDNYGYSSTLRNICDAGLMQGTSGTANTGITAAGGVPTGWTVSRSGSATATATISAKANGIGNTLDLACTFSAANEYIAAQYSIPGGAARFAVGDTVVLEFDVDVSSITNLRGVYGQLLGGGSGIYANAMNLASDTGIPTSNWSGRLRTLPLTIESGTTGLTVTLYAYSHGAGSAAVKLSQVSVVKNTD